MVNFYEVRFVVLRVSLGYNSSLYLVFGSCLSPVLFSDFPGCLSWNDCQTRRRPSSSYAHER